MPLFRSRRMPLKISTHVWLSETQSLEGGWVFASLSVVIMKKRTSIRYFAAVVLHGMLLTKRVVYLLLDEFYWILSFTRKSTPLPKEGCIALLFSHRWSLKFLAYSSIHEPWCTQIAAFYRCSFGTNWEWKRRLGVSVCCKHFVSLARGALVFFLLPCARHSKRSLRLQVLTAKLGVFIAFVELSKPNYTICIM